jgi:4-hydroxy-2-oxoheptanedioate aldolase
MNTLEKFKNRLSKGEAVYGPFMKTADTAFVECAGYAGFDFVILDMEHAPTGFADLQNLIRGAGVAGIVPIVRTPDASGTAIGKALDLGAGGIQVPQIQSTEEAEAVVRAARFFPKGERGVCRFVRAARYSSMPRNEYFESANEALIILQVEGARVLDELDDILSVDGLDILFIGPYDLSQSLGVPGQVAHPYVTAAIERITLRAKQAGALTGIFCDTFEAAARWRQAGIQYLSYSVDTGIFTDACTTIVDKLKQI